MRPLHPLQVRDVAFDVGKILGLVVVMSEGHLHAAVLVLKDGRAGGVRAGVVLAGRGRPGGLHAGRVVQPLGFAVAIDGALARVHAVLPTARHAVAPHAHVGHLVHVRNAVVHGGS